MTCRRCQGCMARDHFLDIQESGGEWWLEGWRCINCGSIVDPLIEQNRRAGKISDQFMMEPVESLQ